MQRCDVVVIGSGNVAEAFARSLATCEGVTLRQIYARNEQRGRAIAQMCGCAWCGEASSIATADIYIIAVSDRAVEEVAASLTVPQEAIIVHTAGSVPMSAIPQRGGRRGIIYPLQSFSKGREIDLHDVPLFIEADSDTVRDSVTRLAQSISSCVEYATSERRRYIHLAGVFVNSFTNHMYAIGGDVLAHADLPFDILKPLISETAAKAIATSDPRTVQTGPAARNDRAVVERHMAMLEGDERKRDIYRNITDSIWETSKKI